MVPVGIVDHGQFIERAPLATEQPPRRPAVARTMRLRLSPSAVYPDVALPAGAAVATPRYGSFGALSAVLDTNSGAAHGEAFVRVRPEPTRAAVKVRVVEHDRMQPECAE